MTLALVPALQLANMLTNSPHKHVEMTDSESPQPPHHQNQASLTRHNRAVAIPVQRYGTVHKYACLTRCCSAASAAPRKGCQAAHVSMLLSVYSQPDFMPLPLKALRCKTIQGLELLLSSVKAGQSSVRQSPEHLNGRSCLGRSRLEGTVRASRSTTEECSSLV